MDLQNKTALVTGSTRGIGKAIAQLLCERGASVYLNSFKSIKEGIILEKELRLRGFDVTYLQGDISEKKDIQKILKIIYKQKRRLDILVNNAGIYKKSRSINSIMYAHYEDFHRVNGWGVYLTTLLASKLMKKGKVINISSIYGIDPNPLSILASGVKSEVVNYTLAFAKLFMGKIEVNSIAPGYTDTSLLHKDIPKNQLVSIINCMPQKKLIQPEEIAQAVVFLLENDGVTGQILVVDGGYTLSQRS
ncbi:MAG: SDR family oxidoreductase [Nanoarchaeota archaeon]